MNESLINSGAGVKDAKGLEARSFIFWDISIKTRIFFSECFKLRVAISFFLDVSN